MSALRTVNAISKKNETQVPSRELVLAAQTGNLNALRELLLRYAPLVVRVAHNATGSADVAKDIAQDTFVIALEDIQALRNPEAFRSWLMQIAVSRARRWFRAERLKRVLGLQSVGEFREAPLMADHLKAEARVDVLRALTLLGHLPFEQRWAWQLRYIEQYTLPEVAEAVDCSLATAKRWLKAAEMHLQLHLEAP